MPHSSQFFVLDKKIGHSCIYQYRVQNDPEQMKTLFLDMEWGQVYGSYRRHFIPIEIGAIISSSENDPPILQGRKFFHNIDLVIRKNITNSVGKTVGFSESVANIGIGEYQKKFDPSYRLQKTDKTAARNTSKKALNELNRYIYTLLKEHHITQIVLFGGAEDLNLLQTADVDISNIEIIDIQRAIRRKIHYIFSLDKISLVIGFYSNKKFFGSKNFRYPLPDCYKHLIKPHRAIGDACRTFVVYQEFHRAQSEFVQQCANYLRASRPSTNVKRLKEPP